MKKILKDNLLIGNDMIKSKIKNFEIFADTTNYFGYGKEHLRKILTEDGIIERAIKQFESDGILTCDFDEEIKYKDKEGKYQEQIGITLPRLKKTIG